MQSLSEQVGRGPCAVTGSLAVKSIGPVTKRLLVRIPEPTRWKICRRALSKALNPNCSCKSVWIRASAKWLKWKQGGSYRNQHGSNSPRIFPPLVTAYLYRGIFLSFTELLVLTRFDEAAEHLIKALLLGICEPKSLQTVVVIDGTMLYS